VQTVPGLPDERSTFAPQGIPVRLVRSDEPGRVPDAVLVAEEDLDDLRRYLTGRPLGETGFLTPGPRSFLIQEPGGLVRDLPFGRPLRRIGPGGLFLSAGSQLYPAVPPSGRSVLFSVAPGVAVVVCDDLVHRFHLEDAVPIWALWAGDLPEVRDGVSGGAAEQLRRFDSVVDSRPRADTPDPEPAPAQRGKLHRDALIAETGGDPIRAAGLLQQAGDFAAAARLLEQAAMGLDALGRDTP
jgi:hypothetical protein